jgi:hypothetical protein
MFGLIETFVVALTTGLAVAFGKELLECTYRLDCCIRRHAQRALLTRDEDETIDPDSFPIIPHPGITDRVIRAVEMGFRYGGVYVFGAPTSAGKTTYVNEAVMTIRTRYPKMIVRVFGNGKVLLADQGIHRRLGVPEDKLLSKFIMKGAVLIIDQADMSMANFEQSMCDYIVELATDSSNSKRYSVIVCVSDPHVYRTIIRLNGMEKVAPIVRDVNTVKWSKDQMKALISSGLHHWSDRDRIALVEVCAISCSPGVVKQAIILSERYSSFHDFTQSDSFKDVQVLAECKSQLWSTFAD